MFIGKSHFSIGDPSFNKSHSRAPAQTEDCVVHFPVWVIMAYF